ncbi:glycosyltransferase family protein [Daejeonella sp. H1SJ63]|uniref:glycosyltransferase family protein n=1 Tax=Daejeonella sp. H1SJ63 TaxID=3034145 RepID=UPI0023EB1D62|nr:glycosyltransferase family protein [Daejeonella sp. H1SJ63]
MKIVAIIQARTGSTRFFNKTFVQLSERPLIWHVVNRLKYSNEINEIVLATTTEQRDDSLQKWSIEENISLFRGSEDDVLSRFYEAAKLYNADIIVRITADDPFKDPEIIDDVIKLLKEKNLDFSSNNYPASFPEGLDTEVFTFAALEEAHLNANDSFDREHVTQYFYRNPTKFKQENYSNIKDISHLRWTLDTEKDYEMVKIIYNHLYKDGLIFKMKDILELLEKYPEISEINKSVKRSDMYS